MFQRFRSVLLIISLAFVVSTPSCKPTGGSTDSSALAFNLEKGKTYVFDMAFEISQGQGDEVQTVNIFAGYDIEVVGESEGIKTLDLTYNSNRIEMDMMGIKVNVDTEKPFVDSSEDNMDIPELVSRVLYAIKGKGFTMKVGREGKVVEVAGLDKLEEQVTQALSSIPKEFSEASGLMFREQFNEKSLREQFESSWHIFPAKEVKQGESWTSEFEANGVKYNNTYSVTKIDGNNVTIQVRSSLTPVDAATNIRGTQTGTYQVDRKTGLVRQGDLIQDMTYPSEAGEMKSRNKTTIRGREK